MSIFEKYDLTKRVAIVTGAAGLLGREYTKTLLEAGATVVMVDLNQEATQQVADSVKNEVSEDLQQSTSGEIFVVTADLSQKSQVQQMTDVVQEKYQRIDILINNAAIDPKVDPQLSNRLANTFEDYPLDAWQQSLDVNLTGVFLCCQSVGKVMVQQQRGCIINICSTYGIVAPDQRLYQRDDEDTQTMFKPAAYAVTKAAIAQFTKYLATYWADKNIRVNTLTPHGIQVAQDEQFLKRFADRSPMGRMATTDEMNGALLFLASDASSYMTGSNLVVDGGWTAW